MNKPTDIPKTNPLTRPTDLPLTGDGGRATDIPPLDTRATDQPEPTLLEQARQAEEAGASPETVMELYRRCAEEGVIEGMFRLGLYLEQRQNPRKPDPQALAWYQKAADLGHAGAQEKIGWAWARGIRRKKDPIQAMNWFSRSQPMEQGLQPFQLGLNLLNSEKQNHPLAIPWLFRAAARDNPLASRLLGECYEQGRGIPRDLKQAAWWYVRADRGTWIQEGEGLYRIARQYLDLQRPGISQLGGKKIAPGEMRRRGVRFLREAAKTGHRQAQYEYGQQLEQTGDHRQAADWYRKSGTREACSRLSTMYLTGTGVFFNPIEALRWANRAKTGLPDPRKK